MRGVASNESRPFQTSIRTFEWCDRSIKDTEFPNTANHYAGAAPYSNQAPPRNT